MKGLSTSLIALLAAAPLAALAQDAIPTLDEIVVTANRTATTLKSTGSPVVVVDQDDMERSGPPDRWAIRRDFWCAAFRKTTSA